MTIIFLSRYQKEIERGVENSVFELSRRLSKEYHVEVHTRTSSIIGKKVDVIYPLNGYLQTLFCRIYAWVVGAKLMVGGHAGIGRDDRWNLYMFPDVFIAFSQKGYDWAKRVNPFVRMVKIPHGVDLEQFNPHVKSKKLDLEHPIFITVSHLLPYKRIADTVKAISQLKKGSLIVLGEGPLEKEIDDLGNNLLGPKRYLRFVVAHKDVASYLTAADIFTLVSDVQEAFGLAYLEALACNLPVVATNDSLRHDLIGDAGLFVEDPFDPSGYGEMLEKAVSIPWGGKPRKQAERFNWDEICQQYFNVLGKIVQ